MIWTFTKENFTGTRLALKIQGMILALTAALFGYLHLSSCRRAEKDYRAAVDLRLKQVCGQHA